MSIKMVEIIVEIPDGVEVDIENNEVRIKGVKGAVSREFPKNGIKITKKDNSLVLSTGSHKKRENALMGSIHGHIKNMIRGVSEGICYKLKIVYSHFPINVKVQGNTMEIDNFFGEKYPRKVDILTGVDVEVNSGYVTLNGVDKEKVSQTAANIEQATRTKKRDPRVFQDGIYIVEKDGKQLIKE